MSDPEVPPHTEDGQRASPTVPEVLPQPDDGQPTTPDGPELPLQPDGPVARALGLAELKFVTAAAATGVSIPGLVESDADALRDRLVGLAESRRIGL